MLRVLVFIGLGVAACSTDTVADWTVGDNVTLVVRPNDIPGHPGDGDPQVSVRLRSGSSARVEQIGNWIRVSGLGTDGSAAAAWILRRYIASDRTPPPDVTLSEIDWCPAKRLPDKHPSGRLRIATWNLGALQAEDGVRLFSDSPAREGVDYDRIRCYTRLIDADIVAVQEVDGIAALRRVFDTDVYELHMSSGSARQDTGFAFKKGLSVAIQPDFQDLDVGDVRVGARIDVTHNGKTLRLMSVHLKSGCFSNTSSGAACTKLQAQVPILERWIDESAASTEPFIVLGDFNRRFNQAGDLVWVELDDATPPNADLTTVTAGMPISCRDNEFVEFIDHIVLDKRASDWFDPSSFRHVTFRQQDKEFWDRISDHCPVLVELWID